MDNKNGEKCWYNILAEELDRTKLTKKENTELKPETKGEEIK